MSTRWTEYLLFAGLFMSTTALLPALAPNSIDHPIGVVPPNWMWPAYFLIAILIILLTSKRFELDTTGFSLCLAPVAYWWLTAFWSVSRSRTIKECLLLSGTVLVAYLCITRLGYKRTIQVISAVLLTVAVLSLAACVLAPGLAHDPIVSGMRGVLVQKNLLGRLMALSIVLEILQIFLLKPTHREKMQAVTRLAIASVTLLLADSATAYVVIGVLSFAALLLTISIKGQLGYITLAVIPLGGIAFYYLLETGIALKVVLAGTDKDATLSNRTLIWKVVDQAISAHPSTGYGYGAFWTGVDGPGGKVSREVGTTLGHAHSGYRDILLQGGKVGLIVVSFSLALLAVRLLVRAVTTNDLVVATRLIIVVFPVAYSVTESNLYNACSIYTIVLILGAGTSGCSPRSSLALVVRASRRRGRSRETRTRLFESRMGG